MRPGYCISCEQNVVQQNSQICPSCEAAYKQFKREEWLKQPSKSFGALRICGPCRGRVLTNGDMEGIYKTCGRECK